MALAANIDAEIDKWYAKPCKQMITLTSVEILSESIATNHSIDELTEMTQIGDKLIDELRPLVQNKSWEERRKLYKKLLYSFVNELLKN